MGVVLRTTLVLPKLVTNFKINNMKKKQTKFTTHQIRSFDDLMKVINEENCDMIFANFYGCVKAFLKFKKKHPELEMSGFDWIDDGKIELKEASVTLSKKFKVLAKNV